MELDFMWLDASCGWMHLMRADWTYIDGSDEISFMLFLIVSSCFNQKLGKVIDRPAITSCHAPHGKVFKTVIFFLLRFAPMDEDEAKKKKDAKT